MQPSVTFDIRKTRFDTGYCPSDQTRITTNFANLARGANREENLRSVLRMIDNRFNAAAHWDNPAGDRYGLALEIISAEILIDEGGTQARFPAIEMLNIDILDRREDRRIRGIVGNNFSSYLRDYDFSVALPAHNAQRAAFAVPDDFGVLHGRIFRNFLASEIYRKNFDKSPVICLSVSSDRTYIATPNRHPVLGVEYSQHDPSLTDHYFGQMGLRVRYFMPPQAVAPLAFYFQGDLTADYTDLELMGTIATMETFQKIYRPEIYNANSVATARYQPSLRAQDHSLTRITYDREERTRLAIEQGKYAETHFVTPYRDLLAQWSGACTA
ncbi:DUF1852 domain-containing protein [Asaia sp. W19]|uniref:putative oxygenase MesX n=1 Tax=unclassified Asaia TaxID=2685023 RepID=UPI000F8EB32F|nr:putative oxygenase MesX [Asaia sp. W19]RUT26382.1 DUF1852 domain-containing protein [Asaia sp. W19]